MVDSDKNKINAQQNIKEVEILIIGFGFSVIPLLRELDLSQKKYSIISVRNSVWKRLEKLNRLDFDLVSSYYTSFYSFDLVDDMKGDMYPTAKQFYNMHLKYYEKYKEKIIDDFVELVENYDGHSLVHTKNRDTYKADNVIVATGFKRKIFDELCDFDYSMSNKTVVFNSIGDSANLMMSKLIPRNNKIICLQNGFVALDKIVNINNKTYTLDQTEFHGFGLLFKGIYQKLIMGGIGVQVKVSGLLFELLSLNFLAKIFTKHTLQTKFNTAREIKVSQKPVAMIPNGNIAIKYWPIDKYAETFIDDLESSIKEGYILNDIAFFVNEGLIKLWPKKDAIVDRESKSVKWNNESVNYDYFVDGDAEKPGLPKIVFNCSMEGEDYEFIYKENYYGVVPKKLNNIYFIGLTRPMTGGLANITEMQCLFVHKMLVNVAFKDSIYSTIEEKLLKYNREHYVQSGNGKTDHLVFYGLYTEEVARVIGINKNLKSCKNIKEINQYLLFPNNTFKYRQEGEYKVDGCDKLVEYIDKNHSRFVDIWYFIASFCLYNILFFELSVCLYAESIIAGPVFSLLIILQLLFSTICVIPVQNYAGLFKVIYLSLAILAVGFLGSKVALVVLPIDFIITYIVRQRGFRYIFNDLKNKVRYRGFFKKYLKAYLKATRT